MNQREETLLISQPSSKCVPGSNHSKKHVKLKIVTRNTTANKMSTVGRVLVSYVGAVCLSLLVTNNSNHIFVKAQSCIDDINEIYQREALVTDPSFFRQYVICPNAIYEFATYDPVGNQIEPPTANVVPPIPLRSNMNIRCGDQGSRENLCWFVGGDVQIDGTATRGIMDDSIENVSIEGFVFIGSRVHGLWATKPGSITFRDCEWRVSSTSYYSFG